MAPNVGLNVTCNTNCSHWCPRALRIFCCCCSVDEKVAHKTHQVAKKTMETKRESDVSSTDLSSFVQVTPEKEVCDEGRQEESKKSDEGV